MGWAYAIEPNGREIGYGVEATCDEPGCEAAIDRGVSYRCGPFHTDDLGCGGYFCDDHLAFHESVSAAPGGGFCAACLAKLDAKL